MDLDEQTMEEKCENLMTVVVDSRKRFRKLCVDYDFKASVMENNMLNLQLETISNYRIKSKNQGPAIDVEDMFKDADNFAIEIVERQKRIEDLRRKVKDTQSIVLQLKGDGVAQKIHESNVNKLLKMTDKDLQKETIYMEEE